MVLEIIVFSLLIFMSMLEMNFHLVLIYICIHEENVPKGNRFYL